MKLQDQLGSVGIKEQLVLVIPARTMPGGKKMKRGRSMKHLWQKKMYSGLCTGKSIIINF
jgi:hypothetical protein